MRKIPYLPLICAIVLFALGPGKWAVALEEPQSTDGQMKERTPSDTTPARFADRLQPLGRILDLSSEGFVVWDCSPIRGPDGKVHVFFTRIPQSQEGWFKNFRTKAEIVHAVADKADGSYTVKEVVLKGRGTGFWDAYGTVNPRIYKIGDLYALFYTAYEIPWPRENMREHIGLLISKDLVTWSRANQGEPILSPSADSGAWDHQIVNNAALLRHPSGKLWLYYRGIGDIKQKNADSSLGVAMADSLVGKWRKFDGNPVLNAAAIMAEDGRSFRGFEDPCVWYEDGKVKMLTKDMGYFAQPAGAYFESDDGLNWGKPKRGYETPDDTPQILFNDRGIPEYLFVNRHAYEGEPLSGFVFNIKPDANRSVESRNLENLQ